jgi:hypothetical protein
MYKMKKTAFILGAAMVATPGVEGQAYADALTDYALNDLSAILAAYDVGDYSSNSENDYTFDDSNEAAFDSSSYSDSEYEEVGPVDVEFGDYPSGFDDQYFDGDSEEIVTPDENDFTDERLRPNKFEFDFDQGSSALEKAAQTGTGSHSSTTFNNCRICNGETASDCITSGVVETCNEVQPVCQVTVRIARKGADPLYWSECKSQKSCFDDEEQNFSPNGVRFDQCRSTKMAARFFHGSTCTFCMKLGTATDQLIFQDTTGDNALKILTGDGLTPADEINIADALSDPSEYFAPGANSYIYDSQTWYLGAMGSP